MSKNSKNKNSAISSPEEYAIYPVVIASLANNSEHYYKDATELIEFVDIPITFRSFISFFYENNGGQFEINTQYRYSNELLFSDKSIKPLVNNNYMNYNLTTIDIIKDQFINNKKTKIPDGKYLSFVRDISKYNSILDYKIYVSKLNLNDVLNLFSTHYSKNNKTHFRFKIITNYYSHDLDESASFCLNYLCEIPENLLPNDNIVSSVPRVIEPVKPVVEPVKPVDEPVKPVDEPVKPVDEPVKPAVEPVPIHDSFNKKNVDFSETYENIVYSNYYENDDIENDIENDEIENYEIVNDVNVLPFDLKYCFEDNTVHIVNKSNSNAQDFSDAVSTASTDYCDDDETIDPNTNMPWV